MKKLYILSIVAIVFIFIMHIISWAPLVSRCNEVKDYWDEHIYEEHGYRASASDDCDDCESYSESVDSYNQSGAMLWQDAITNCVLIAFAGAITYGIGVLVDKKKQENNPYANNTFNNNPYDNNPYNNNHY